MTAIFPTTESIPFARTLISLEAREAAMNVLESGWVTTGPEVQDFEYEFANYVSSPHAVAVSSCTAAIEIALRALRLPPNAKVLTSTVTFAGAVHAIVHAGLRPVLVDVDPETLMPTPATTAAAVAAEGTADAMVVLHLAGHPAPVEELAQAARLPLGRVIEDAAHALFTKVGSRDVGSISAATCFSFYATKNLPIGEGGMITTADPEIYEQSRQIRIHGMSSDAWKRYLPGASWKYSIGLDGIKANMTDVQASIGRAQLRHLDAWQARRTEIALRYDSVLRGIDGLRTPPWPSSGRHAWHLYILQVDAAFGMSRDAFITILAERGVHCSVHFVPVHRHPYFARLLGSESAQRLRVADEATSRIVSLPLYPTLKDSEVDRICEEVWSLHQEGGL